MWVTQQTIVRLAGTTRQPKQSLTRILSVRNWISYRQPVVQSMGFKNIKTKIL